MTELHYSVLLSIAAFLMLFTALIIEWLAERYGEGKKNHGKSAFVRVCWAFLSSIASVMLRIWSGEIKPNATWLQAGLVYASTIFMALSIHFLVFDYLIAATLKRNNVINPQSNWFNYLGKSSWIDTRKWWIACGPWVRFGIRLAVFAIALLIYF